MLNALMMVPETPTLALESARVGLERWLGNRSPVFLIVIAIAIVVGIGIIAFLTYQCIQKGYIGFGAVVDISKHWTHWDVKFTCI